MLPRQLYNGPTGDRFCRPAEAFPFSFAFSRMVSRRTPAAQVVTNRHMVAILLQGIPHILPVLLIQFCGFNILKAFQVDILVPFH